MTRCVWVDSRRAEGFPVTVACSATGIANHVLLVGNQIQGSAG